MDDPHGIGCIIRPKVTIHAAMANVSPASQRPGSLGPPPQARATTRLMPLALGLLFAACSPAVAETLHFAGRTWTVRSGRGGPGPNVWETRNVWLDAAGHLHLKIRHENGVWSCAEVTLQQRLGFGRYRFEVEGPIDRLDEHVVLGLFNYPTGDVGGDATHEIDIEFARWGSPLNPIGNYTVWPVEKSLKSTSRTFPFTLTGSVSAHAFDWGPERIAYESWQGADASRQEIARWMFEPDEPRKRIAREPMPVHLNLWLFQGKPPRDGQEVEVVIRRFTFTPR